MSAAAGKGRRPPSTRPSRAASWGWAFGGLALLLMTGVVAERWWSAQAPARQRRLPGASVLLITVDTLRADALGAYGRSGAGTPWMDRLAAEGVRFDDAHAHNVVTLPSHANILSGRHPFEHGVRDNAGFRFPATLPTLATLLKERGYRTGAFVSAFPLAARFGLDRGFDVYDDGFASAEGRPALVVQERPGAETVARALRFVSSSPARYFCWVHVYEPHFPYAPPRAIAERFPGEPYQAEVAATDAVLGRLLQPLLEAGRAGPLVVLTADHGEALGEHGEATHSIFAYEATLRVPLVLWQPALLAPGVVGKPARHVDILPTILDALALPPPGGLPGHSLSPQEAGHAPDPGPTYFEALSGQLNRGWAPLYGLVEDGRKYVELPIPELYDLRSDPHERRDLSIADGSGLERLRARLRAYRVADQGRVRSREAAETLERLRSLGYVSSAAPARALYGDADDPKRLISLDAALHDVAAAYLAGDLRAAIERCRALVAARPTMALSLLTLAQLAREAGDLPAAADALRKALALNPDDASALSLLGATLTQAGRPREAVALLETAGRGPEADLDVRIALAQGLARLGRFGDALAVLDGAAAAFPRHALVRVHAGTVRLMQGDRAGARAEFERALALDPQTARARSSLGYLDAEEGRLAAAVEQFRLALASDPREADTLRALVARLEGQGKADAARPFLELLGGRPR